MFTGFVFSWAVYLATSGLILLEHDPATVSDIGQCRVVSAVDGVPMLARECICGTVEKLCRRFQMTKVVTTEDSVKNRTACTGYYMLELCSDLTLHPGDTVPCYYNELRSGQCVVSSRIRDTSDYGRIRLYTSCVVVLVGIVLYVYTLATRSRH